MANTAAVTGLLSLLPVALVTGAVTVSVSQSAVD